MQVMLKSLREERKNILYFSTNTSRDWAFLYVPIKEVNVIDYTVSFDDEDGKSWTLPLPVAT